MKKVRSGTDTGPNFFICWMALSLWQCATCTLLPQTVHLIGIDLLNVDSMSMSPPFINNRILGQTFRLLTHNEKNKPVITNEQQSVSVPGWMRRTSPSCLATLSFQVFVLFAARSRFLDTSYVRHNRQVDLVNFEQMSAKRRQVDKLDCHRHCFSTSVACICHLA